MIHQVVIWTNGMVMTMDEAGNQLPNYQGPLDEVREAILRDAPPEAGFQKGVWQRTDEGGQKLTQITREAFAAAVTGR